MNTREKVYLEYHQNEHYVNNIYFKKYLSIKNFSIKKYFLYLIENNNILLCSVAIPNLTYMRQRVFMFW